MHGAAHECDLSVKFVAAFSECVKSSDMGGEGGGDDESFAEGGGSECVDEVLSCSVFAWGASLCVCVEVVDDCCGDAFARELFEAVVVWRVAECWRVV